MFLSPFYRASKPVLKSLLICDFCFDAGLRQERPAHLHPESIYQAMRERGRAIPATPTVPIVERKTSPSNPPPRIVDGRVSYDFDLQLIFAIISAAGWDGIGGVGSGFAVGRRLGHETSVGIAKNSRVYFIWIWLFVFMTLHAN